MTRSPIVAVALAGLIPFSALAADCEANFQKKGNPLTGTQYVTSVDVDGDPVANALAQVREAGRADGMDVVNDDAANGSVLLEDPETFQHKAIPVLVSGSLQGRTTHVEMSVRTGRGAFASGDAMKGYMCKLLAAVKPGKVAKAAASATGRTPTPVVAWQFAQRIQRESKDNVAAIDSRYKGKPFRIKGVVSNVHASNGRSAVFFKSSSELAGDIDFVEATLMCRIAPSQASFALSLREGDRVELTGTFDHYDLIAKNIVMADCRP